jgi:hypothetical protein
MNLTPLFNDISYRVAPSIGFVQLVKIALEFQHSTLASSIRDESFNVFSCRGVQRLCANHESILCQMNT